jgi:PAS domain-containing protein
VPRGFYSHERLAAEHPDIPLITTDGELEALRAVASGQADAFVGNVAIASYLIDKYGLASLKVAAPTEFENSELCMGIRADLPMLHRIIQKGLDGLPAEDQDSIRQRWISVRYEYGLNPRDIWRGIAAALLILGPVAIASFYYTRRLQKQILRRKATEASLAVKSGLLETTLEHMAQGILMAGDDGTVLAYNHHYQEFFGYSDAFLAARPNISQIFEDYWRPRGMDDAAIARVIADSKRRDFFTYELPSRRPRARGDAQPHPQRRIRPHLHRHHRPQARRGGDPATRRGRTGRQPRQGRFPCEHESRNPHPRSTPSSASANSSSAPKTSPQITAKKSAS